MKRVHHLLLPLAVCIVFCTLSSSRNINFSYEDYCGSFVSKATVIGHYDGSLLSGSSLDGFCQPYSDWNLLYLNTHTVRSTSSSKVFNVEAQLLIFGEQSRHNITLAGFWSAPTGHLCLVGSQNDVGLRLNGVQTSRNITSLITGRLEFSNGSSVALGFFSKGTYQYSEIEKVLNSPVPRDIDVPSNLSLSSDNDVSSVMSGCTLNLVNKPGCNSTKCNPLEDRVGYLPQSLMLRGTGAAHRYRGTVVLEFPDVLPERYPSFSPSNFLIGEVAWDPKRRKMLIAACSVLPPSTESESFRVDDCAIRIYLRFPRVLTAANPNSIVGYMWTTKDTNDSAFFERIMLRGNTRFPPSFCTEKYEFTLMEKANESCPSFEHKYKGKPRFPDYLLYLTALGGDIHIGSPAMYVSFTQFFPTSGFTQWKKLNALSFQIDLYIDSHILITAEGMYDNTTGQLCMAGCRNVDNSELPDCEIFIRVQFPPLNSRHMVKGVITSTRQKNDSLSFATTIFTTVPYYTEKGRVQWSIEFEAIMFVVATTLECLCVAYQILYVKRSPEVCSCISKLMLCVIIVDYLAALVLFGNKSDFSYSSMFQMIRLVILLLHARLLKHVWSHSRGISWEEEKRTLFVTLGGFLLGGYLVFEVNKGTYGMFHGDPMWVQGVALNGFILDVYLWPQIVMNMWKDSREHGLSLVYFVGISLVRWAPHAYSAFRKQTYADHWLLAFAFPSYGFVPQSWNYAMMLVIVLFGFIVFIQQLFGGRCFWPQRFRKHEQCF